MTGSVLTIPRKSVRRTWENKSVHTQFASLFRNFDLSLGKMLTYELFKIVEFYYFLKDFQGSPFTTSVHELLPETLVNGR